MAFESSEFQELLHQVSPLVFRLEIEETVAPYKVHFGTAFHIGSGLLATAKHNVKDTSFLSDMPTTTIQNITNDCYDDYVDVHHGKPIQILSVYAPSNYFPCAATRFRSGTFGGDQEPIDFRFMEVIEDSDFALLVTDLEAQNYIARTRGLPTVSREASALHLAAYKEFRIEVGKELLRPVLCVGYPPIPHLQHHTPLHVLGHVAAMGVGLDGLWRYILSGMARGGLSGCPVFNPEGVVIGIVCQSLTRTDDEGEALIQELGYLSANTPTIIEILRFALTDGPITLDIEEKLNLAFGSRPSKIVGEVRSEIAVGSTPCSPAEPVGRTGAGPNRKKRATWLIVSLVMLLVLLLLLYLYFRFSIVLDYRSLSCLPALKASFHITLNA